MFSQLVNLINKEEKMQERHNDTIRITNFARSGAAFAIAEGLGKTVFINRHTAEETGVEVGHRYGAILVRNRALDVWDASSQYARPADMFAIFVDPNGADDEEAVEEKATEEVQPEPQMEVSPIEEDVVKYMETAKVFSASDIAAASGRETHEVFDELRRMYHDKKLHKITVSGHEKKRTSFVFWCEKSTDAKDVILRGLAADD